MKACPFCGASARTKEHVWPKWLRQYKAYEAMNVDPHGDRFERVEHVRGKPGKTETRRVAKGLPNVTADVCAECNNGWMSRLEIRARKLLDTSMRTDGQIRSLFEPEDLDVLATWFTKCVYAYEAAVFSEGNRAWPSTAYAALRAEHLPPTDATIWMGKSVGSHADMVISTCPVWAIPLEAGGNHRPIEPAQMVSAWMSANSVVFFGLWMWPELVSAGRPQQLASSDVGQMKRIWPHDSRPIRGPRRYVSDSQAASLINLVADLRDGHGINMDLLGYQEVEAVKSEMREVALRDGFRPSFAMINRVRARR